MASPWQGSFLLGASPHEPMTVTSSPVKSPPPAPWLPAGLPAGDVPGGPEVAVGVEHAATSTTVASMAIGMDLNTLDLIRGTPSAARKHAPSGARSISSGEAAPDADLLTAGASRFLRVRVAGASLSPGPAGDATMSWCLPNHARNDHMPTRQQLERPNFRTLRMRRKTPRNGEAAVTTGGRPASSTRSTRAASPTATATGLGICPGSSSTSTT